MSLFPGDVADDTERIITRDTHDIQSYLPAGHFVSGSKRHCSPAGRGPFRLNPTGRDRNSLSGQFHRS